ncbi:MAG TPA: hypothetical protein DCW90_07525 [Lachnospiraceae bacterium]|nr:hypothetical protein [Lachnospiraceae bacterium]
MVSIKVHIPKSAKDTPCWVFIDGKYDLAYLTEDEKYFVSIDYKRVYSLEVVSGWSIPSP